MRLHLVVFLAVAVAWPLYAQEPATVEQDRATTAAIRKAYEVVLPTLVLLKIEILEDPDAPYEDRAPIENLFDEFVRQRVPLRLCGVRIAPDGTTILRDPNLPLSRYGNITATDRNGRTMQMRVAAVLERYAGIILEPTRPPAEKLPFLAFEEARVEPGDTMLIGQQAFIEEMVCLKVEAVPAAAVGVEGREKLRGMIWWQDGTLREMLGNLVPATTPVVLDAQARPIGLALDNGLWQTAEGGDSWIGRRIMADRRNPTESLETTGNRILAIARQSIKEIEIQFRSDSRLGQQLRPEEGKATFYGVMLNREGRIFVPTDMDRDAIRQIEKISVVEGDKRIETTFEGLFRDFGAFLVRAKDLSGEPARLVDNTTLPRGKLFYTVSIRRRYGRRHEEVEYNRYLDVATGYKEASYPVPRKPIRTGDLVADAEGGLIGFCAPFRREDKDEILARQSRRPGAAARGTRIYLFSEVGAMLKDPRPHLDQAARPMSRKEERRLVWLGVEYQPMSPALARALNVESACRGGSRGLLVTHVYEQSPAARNQIKVGDILLSLGAAGMHGEIDLAVPARAPETRPAEGPASARLWRPRTNYLTLLLTQLGEGREVRLTFLQDGKEKSLTLVLEKAPDDFDSADQFQEASLGLTVKEMTYEVRSVLRLPPDAPGVVVSEVTPGSKAAIAQIRPYEIISMVDNQPATSLKEFERLLRSAQARGRTELLVTNLGMSRIVELDLTGAAQ